MVFQVVLPHYVLMTSLGTQICLDLDTSKWVCLYIDCGTSPLSILDQGHLYGPSH